jgi:hypothetical protein
MKCGIGDPSPELFLIEKYIFMTKYIHRGISIQHTRGHCLIKDTDHNRWQKGEKDIEARHGPRFIES